MHAGQPAVHMLSKVCVNVHVVYCSVDLCGFVLYCGCHTDVVLVCTCIMSATPGCCNSASLQSGLLIEGVHAQAGISYKSACSIITARECGSQHVCCIAKKAEVAVHEAAMAS